jgi:hypothetical protein
VHVGKWRHEKEEGKEEDEARGWRPTSGCRVLWCVSCPSSSYMGSVYVVEPQGDACHINLPISGGVILMLSEILQMFITPIYWDHNFRSSAEFPNEAEPSDFIHKVSSSNLPERVSTARQSQR